MKLLYAIPWVVWFLWFVAWEAWGFRTSKDHWPTLSQVVKWWEDRKTARKFTSDVYPLVETKVVPRGLITWTWKRWCIAAGLPVLAIVLELHWVWELF